VLAAGAEERVNVTRILQVPLENPREVRADPLVVLRTTWAREVARVTRPTASGTDRVLATAVKAAAWYSMRTRVYEALVQAEVLVAAQLQGPRKWWALWH
jgi:hypothetical protein